MRVWHALVGVLGVVVAAALCGTGVHAADLDASAGVGVYSQSVLEQLAQEQVASGALTQAEADAGLVVVRVINHAITQRLTAADDEGDEYDEAFAKQAADYSAAAYYGGAPDQALNWQAQNSNFELGTKVSKPYLGSEISAYTGIDRSKNLIVVGYEGTSEGPKQLIAEAALAIPRPVEGCPGCKTTTYFGEGAAKLYPDLQKSVKELQQKCPNCKVLFTGHSLGGAMAQNGAFQMMKDGTLKEPPKYYTFGQPKAGNPAFNEAFNKAIPNAYRVTHDKDLVPQVGARARGTNIGKEVSYDDKMTGYRICNGGGCGDKLRTELVKDLKQNAKDTLGKPMPTWGDVFRHPIKTAKDLASRPIDFAKKQAGSLKEDLGHSVDQHLTYFNKDLGGEFDAKDADIKKYAEEQQKKAAKPALMAPAPFMSMPDEKKEESMQREDGKKDDDKAPNTRSLDDKDLDLDDGKGKDQDKAQEKLDDKAPKIKDRVQELIGKDKDADAELAEKEKKHKDKKKAEQEKRQKDKLAKDKKKKDKQDKLAKEKAKKKQKKDEALKKKNQAKQPKAKDSKNKKAKSPAKPKQQQKAKAKAKRSRSPARRGKRRAARRAARRGGKRRAAKRRTPKRRSRGRGAR